MEHSNKSVRFPGIKFGPKTLTFYPGYTLPDKTLPKAKNLDLSAFGTIFEMKIESGPF